MNATRDEQAWRQASQGKRCGAVPSQNAMISALKSWETVALSIFKAVIDWAFGQAAKYDMFEGAHVLYANGLLLLTGLNFLLTLFGIFLAFRRFKGPQSATCGHIQTIINLIVDWGKDGEFIFWGDKGPPNKLRKPEIRQAGTAASTELVGPIYMDALYR